MYCSGICTRTNTFGTLADQTKVSITEQMRNIPKVEIAEDGVAVR